MALLPPMPLVGEKPPIADPSLYVLDDGQDTLKLPARADRLFPLSLSFTTKDTHGLLVDAENQSSIGDVLYSYDDGGDPLPPLDSLMLFDTMDAEREASEPTNG
jgi:hypothetical protein